MSIPEGRRGRLDKLYDDETSNELQAYIEFLRNCPGQETPRSMYREFKRPSYQDSDSAAQEAGEDGEDRPVTPEEHVEPTLEDSGGSMIKRRGRSFVPELPKSFLPKLLGNKGDFRTVRSKARKKQKGIKFPAKFGVLRAEKRQRGHARVSLPNPSPEKQHTATALSPERSLQSAASLSPGIGPPTHHFDFNVIDQKQRQQFAQGGVTVQELLRGSLLDVQRDAGNYETRLDAAKKNNPFLNNPTVNLLEPFEQRIVQYRLDSAEPDILNRLADKEIKDAQKRKKLEKKLEKRARLGGGSGEHNSTHHPDAPLRAREGGRLSRPSADGTRKPVTGEEIAMRLEILASKKALRDPVGAALSAAQDRKVAKQRRKTGQDDEDEDMDPDWQPGDETIIIEEGLLKQEKVYRSHDLRLAVAEGDTAQVERLLDIGLSIRTKDQGQPLVLVVFLRYLDELKRRDARKEAARQERRRRKYDDPAPGRRDPGAAQEKKDGSGDTNSEEPEGRGQKAMLRLLLQRGAPINVLEDPGVAKGWAALHYAVASGRLRAVQFLVHEAGADVNLRTDRRVLPLHMAAHRADLRISLFLLRAGANVDPGDSQGRTPLHYAAEVGAGLVSELLLRAGADNHACDDQEVFAYQLATQQGFKKLGAKIRVFAQSHAPRDVLIDFLETTMLKAKLLSGQGTEAEREAASAAVRGEIKHGYVENIERDLQRRKAEKAARLELDAKEKKKGKKRAAWGSERARLRASWARKTEQA